MQISPVFARSQLLFAGFQVNDLDFGAGHRYTDSAYLHRAFPGGCRGKGRVFGGPVNIVDGCAMQLFKLVQGILRQRGGTAEVALYKRKIHLPELFKG